MHAAVPHPSRRWLGRLLLPALGLAALLAQGPSVGAPRRPTREAAPARKPASVRFDALPAIYEENLGQVDEPVKYVSRGPGYALYLTPAEAVLSLEGFPPETRNLKSGTLRMSLAGANPNPPVAGDRKLPGVSHYLRGQDRSAWKTGVPQYARVRYGGVYPGVDLVYHGRQRQLEYDFVLAPGVEPSTIRMRFTSPASEAPQRPPMKIDRAGDLIIPIGRREVRQRRPVAYQEIGGARRRVAARYVLRNADSDTPEVGFQLGRYDRKRPLVIDPVLTYSTYLGGDGGAAAAPPDEAGYGIDVDAAGNTYVTGFTTSANFPLVNPQQPALAGKLDLFVMKLRPDGAAPVYSTYIGGSGDDLGYGVRIDAAGNAYVAGSTTSKDFPTAFPFQRESGGKQDAFVLKLNATGSGLVYSTYLGGNGDETASALDIDGTGAACVVGSSSSFHSFPLIAPLQFVNSGGAADAFVAKLNPAGSSLVYSTYLGGRGDDRAWGVAMDSSGAAYVTGRTASPDFPNTAGSFDSTYAGTGGFSYDAFVTKLDATGSGLVYSTFLGGASPDEGLGIAVDGGAAAYVTGVTASTDFPTRSAFQPALRGATDAFVTKLDAAGSSLAYSTYLGGADPAAGEERGMAIGVDVSGNAWVAGRTESSDFPLQAPLQAIPGGAGDAFVTQVDRSGSSLLFSTLLGGTGDDHARALGVAANGGVYLTGFTTSADFPVAGAFQQVYGGGSFDAFVLKLGPGVAPPPPAPLPAPIALTALAAGPTQINLAWQDRSPDETGFEIERKSGAASFTRLATVGPNVRVYSDSGLSPNTAYTYRVRATGPRGPSAYSNEATALTRPTPPAPPPAPVVLTATVVSPTEVALAWTDNSTQETGFKIERRAGNGPYSLMGTTQADVLVYHDRGLLPNTEYTYRVRATNAGGDSAPSPEVRVAPDRPRPTPPTDLVVRVVESSRVDVSFKESSPDETGFALERKLADAPGDFIRIATLGPNVTTYRDSGLASGKTYVYRVRTLVPGGESDPSAEARLTAPTTTAPGRLAFSPEKLNVGTVQIGSRKTATVRLRNTGQGPLEVTVPMLAAPFAVSPTGPLRLAKGASATLTLTFSPTAAGSASGKLTLTSDDPNRATAAISLSGKATGAAPKPAPTPGLKR